VGTDVLLGRTITIDPKRAALDISRAAGFPTGPDGRTRHVTFDGALIKRPFTVQERVVAARDGSVTLEIVQDAGQRRTFDATVPYSPTNLHRWGRPFAGASCSESSDLYAVFDESGCSELYAPIGDLALDDIRVVSGEVYADPRGAGLCVDERSEARMRGRDVIIDETRCYADPWVMRAAEVSDASSGERLLRLVSEG
jgi:hypothetical protein